MRLQIQRFALSSTLLQEDHDNRYLTDRIRQLDAQRRKRGKPLLLLPLRQKERHHLIDINSYVLSRSETKKLGVWLIFWFLFVVFGAILMTVDGGLYFVLSKLNSKYSCTPVERFSRNRKIFCLQVKLP